MPIGNSVKSSLMIGTNCKSDICEARHLTSEQFDKLVNEEVFFLAAASH